jgi:hypothetical protein
MWLSRLSKSRNTSRSFVAFICYNFTVLCKKKASTTGPVKAVALARLVNFSEK